MPAEASVDISTLTTRDGRELEVLTGGDPDGLPWLFHNGSPSSAVPHAPFSETASDLGLRLISYARPGYGGASGRRWSTA